MHSYETAGDGESSCEGKLKKTRKEVLKVSAPGPALASGFVSDTNAT